MLASGSVYRVLAARSAVPLRESRSPLDPNSLGGLPLQIGNWVGRDVPLDETLVDATGADAYINREYSRHNGPGEVLVYVACGANVNEVMSHRPTGCYRYAGWTLESRQTTGLQLPDTSSVPCTVYEFSRQGSRTGAEKMVVLHYCFAEGQYFDEVMKVMAEGLRGFRTVRWAAQVQIAATQRALVTAVAGDAVWDFAVASVPLIDGTFQSIAENRLSDVLSESNEGE